MKGIKDAAFEKKKTLSFFTLRLGCRLSLFNAARGKEALVNYKTALQLNPNHTVALVNMGRHLRAAGNIQEAEQAYKRFVLRYRTYVRPQVAQIHESRSYQISIIYERVSSETFRAL